MVVCHFIMAPWQHMQMDMHVCTHTQHLRVEIIITIPFQYYFKEWTIQKQKEEKLKQQMNEDKVKYEQIKKGNLL